MKNLQNNMKVWSDAKLFIPGGTQLLSKRPDQFSEGIWPSYYSSAKGVEVWDLDNNKYVDMSIGGIGATILGYADPDVDGAVKDAIDKGVATSLNCPEEVELANVLCEIHPWADMARFARSGGEAMAMAVRIARAATGKDIVAFCGYHGWHDWYLSANIGTENALGEYLLPGLDPVGVPKALKGTSYPFHYNNLDELEQIAAKHGNDLGVIVVEAIRNDPPTPEFRDGIREIADRTGAVLIVDEISSGFRYLTGGAHLKFGIKPDMAVFSKALGNGYAIAAVIGTGEVMQAAQLTFISSTNWTERIGPVAALAMIEKHKKVNAGKHLTLIGKKVQEGWLKAANKVGLDIDVGGIPQMSHFSFDNPVFPEMKAYFIQLMLEEGFLASNSFYAMYAHSDNNVSRYLDCTVSAFSKLKDSLEEGTLESKLHGHPSGTGFSRLT